MSAPRHLAALREDALDRRSLDSAGTASAGAHLRLPPWVPTAAPVAHVATSEVIFDEPILGPCDAADWARIIRRAREGTHAAFLLDGYRNVAAAWFTDADDVNAALTYALSTDIRELALRELVLVSAVDELGDTTDADRDAFRRMVRRAKRRSATLLDWVVGAGDRARSMRLAVEPGNDWPAPLEPDVDGWWG